MTIKINNAHTVRLSYSYHFNKAGLEAAQLFVQWLTDTASHELLTRGYRCIITSATMGELSADKRVVLVRTDWIESDEL